jgi:MarR family transcriptional regulator, transcriptional regulator for hemolysin
MTFREIFREFVLVDRRVTNELDEVIGGCSLTLSSWKVIDFIERSGTCTLVEISRHLSIEKPSVTRTINCLEEKRLVEQVTGKDKREKRIRLTSSGKEVYAACRSSLDHAELGLLNGISDEEQKMLLRSLTTIRDNLK